VKKIISLLLLFTVIVVGCSQTSLQVSNKIISLREPPELIVTFNNKSISAVRGTYSWYIDNGDGTCTGIESDSGPPPELVEFQEELLNVKPKSSIALDFGAKPDDYKVRIWQSNNPITQQVNNGIIISPQQKGLVVYEVHATWKEGNSYYAFSVNVD